MSDEITFDNKGSHGLFIFSENIGLEEEELLTAVLEAGKISGCDKFIFDLRNTINIDTKFYRTFTTFSNSIDATIATINLGKTLKKELIDAGLENVFNPVGTYSNAIATLGLVSSKSQSQALDVEFLNPFIKATIDTFGVQANTEIVLGKPFVKESKINLPMDIAGIIGITSIKFSGNLALCFSSDIFLKIYSNMLGGEKFEKIDDEIEDAAGEFTNIILGQAKASLNDKKGYQIDKAIPSVIRGKGITLNHLSATASIVVPFIVEEDEFYLDICFDENSN